MLNSVHMRTNSQQYRSTSKLISQTSSVFSPTLTNQRMTLIKLKPRTSTYTISRSSMVGCFAVVRARPLVPGPSTPARLRASIDPIDSRFDWCSMFVPHEPRGRTIRLTLRGTKKLISAPACSRTMGIDFLESLAPISYGDVPSLSPPVDRTMPNEGAVIMSPSESLNYI